MAAFTPTGVEFVARGLNSYLRDLGKANKAQQTNTKSLSGLAKTAGKVGVGLAVGAATGVVALSTAVVGLGAVSIKTAISFESAFAGVIKTTDGLTDSTGKLTDAGKELREGFVDLSKEVPLAFEELAAIGELGGQLGIGKDALIDFTESVAALGVSTNLSTEEAATGLARISNIFAVSTDDMGANIGQLGSTIVALGNSFATTERDILSFGERIAGAGAIAGLSQADILGIGAAMSSVGVEAEAGGTAVQKVLLAMNNAVAGSTTGFVDNTDAIDKNIAKLTKMNGRLVELEAITGLTGDQILQMRDEFIAAGGTAEEFGRQLGDKNRRALFDTASATRKLSDQTKILREQQGKPVSPKQLEKFAKVAGISADKFKDKWENDAAGAFELFVEGLAKQGDDAVGTLEDLELTDQRLVRAFLSLAGAGDLLGESLDLANLSFEENTALQDEAAKRYATTESQLLILKNTIRAIGDTIGSRFLPLINQMIQFGKELIDEWAEPMAMVLDTQVIPSIISLIGLIGQLPAKFQQLQAVGGNLFTDLFNAEKLQELATGLIADIPTILSTIVTSITSFLQTQGPVISQTLNSWADTFWEWVNIVISNAGIFLAGIGVAIAAWATGPGQTQLLELGNVLGQALVDGIAFWLDNQEQFAAVLAKVVAGLGAAALAITGLLIVIGSQIVAGMIQGMLEKIGIDLQPALFSELTSIFTSIGQSIVTLWQQIGNNVMEGFSEGILAGITNIHAAIAEITTVVINAWKSELGISSPSTVFMQFGIDTIQGFINGILSMAGEITSVISSLFSDLFAGESGEGAAPEFDTESIATGMTQATDAIASLQINWDAFTTSVITFTSATLPVLQEVFLATTTLMLSQVTLLIQTGILMLDLALVNLTTITIPNLLAVMTNANAAIAAQIQTNIQLTIDFGNQMTMLGTIAETTANKIVKAFEKVAKAFERSVSALKKLIEVMKSATEEAIALATALERAAKAKVKAGATSAAATGIGFSKGLGFAAGTPQNTNGLLGLGFKIPSGFPDDSFGPMFAQSGEEMLITPRGTSIESLVLSRLANLLGGLEGGNGDTYHFDVDIETGSNPMEIVQSLDIMKALVT